MSERNFNDVSNDNHTKELGEESFCPQCGVAFSKLIASISRTCPCCNASLENKNTDDSEPQYNLIPKSDKIVRINKAFDNDKFIDGVKTKLKKQIFVPKDFFNKKNIERIETYYVPIWLYDIEVNGSVTYDCEVAKGTGKHRKFEKYEGKSQGEVIFKDIPVIANQANSSALYILINFGEKCSYEPYDALYLKNSKAKFCNVNVNNSFEFAQQQASIYTDTVLIPSKFNVSANVKQRDYDIKPQKLSSLYFPIKKMTLSYNHKKYYAYMNASNGECEIDELPSSYKNMYIGVFLLMSSICLSLVPLIYIFDYRLIFNLLFVLSFLIVLCQRIAIHFWLVFPLFLTLVSWSVYEIYNLVINGAMHFDNVLLHNAFLAVVYFIISMFVLPKLIKIFGETDLPTDLLHVCHASKYVHKTDIRFQNYEKVK